MVRGLMFEPAEFKIPMIVEHNTDLGVDLELTSRPTAVGMLSWLLSISTPS